ncbi:hypothetical protein JTB14_037664 [Gonioctena quinquepunctata]|nr:hypothetical protein JTB14_037664 [Gonioctena quinquepunctata]
MSSFVGPMTGRFGRRSLLAFSGIGMAVSEAALATYSYLQTKDYEMPAWMAPFPVVCLVVFIITHNSGYGLYRGRCWAVISRQGQVPYDILLLASLNWTLPSLSPSTSWLC